MDRNETVRISRLVLMHKAPNSLNKKVITNLLKFKHYE